VHQAQHHQLLLQATPAAAAAAGNSSSQHTDTMATRLGKLGAAAAILQLLVTVGVPLMQFFLVRCSVWTARWQPGERALASFMRGGALVVLRMSGSAC
jgi:hypothetical protein